VRLLKESAMLTFLTIVVLGLTPPVGEVVTPPVIPPVAPQVVPQPDVDPAALVARTECYLRESKMIAQIGDLYDRFSDRAYRLRCAKKYNPRRDLATRVEIELLDRVARCLRVVEKALRDDYMEYWGFGR
jgi:hypothetical protein